MAELDFTRAKARLANEMDARLPVVEPEGRQLRMRHARYPLLLFRAQEQPFEVIPLEMHLDPQRRIVVISGPNAGGKSVSLKTAGLLQLMLQCGLLVPADETSVFPLFGSLFLDIGDEQSVESDLSTYTSRLYQWRQMGDHMDSRSLFLIDEFGSGTDPKQGGAIAEAFLERFVHQKAYGIITTHYGNLKDYAEVTPGVMNAAMQFDTEGLRPTYRFIEGMPGRSYAFEMAQRVGVHPTILKKARKKVGADELESEHLLRELERKHVEMGRLVAENQRKEAELARLLEQNRKQQQELAAKKNSIIREAREEARALIRQTNQQIERTIREIRESQAEQVRTRQARKELEAALPLPDPVLDAPVLPVAAQEEEQDGLVALPGEPVQAGDWVKLRQGETFGRLAEVQGTRAIMESGDLRLTVKLNQLVKIRPPKAARSRGGVTVLGDLPSSTARFELDVMGMRAEAALAEVDKFIDEARMAGLTPVRILHGKGGGVLRETIRRHLSGIHVVRRTYDAPADAGGAGWTIVDLDA
jgi:DNA mismatch repair protein MutS2